jgi:glycosyltransferase involved in cell wall biosynthesis
MQKKIMLWSVNPKISTGYGMASLSILKILIKLGYDVIFQSSYGNYSFIDEIIVESKTIKILPALNSKKYGSDVIIQNIKEHKPDLILQFFDIFAIGNMEEINKLCPVISLLMIDSVPFMECNNHSLQHITSPVCVVKSAIKEIKIPTKNPPQYLPLPISSSYYIEDKVKSRKHFNELICKGESRINEDTKLITVVSNNCGEGGSARKNILNIIRAWPIINKEIPNAVLYLHMDISGRYSGGIDLGNFINTNIPKEDIDKYFGNVIYPSPLKYSQSKYTQNDMRYIYNSSDIYLNPSNSEGFGMPIIEASACGVPSLVTNFLASKELVENCIEEPSNNLLNGTLIDVGFNSRRMHVTEFEIANKTINLLQNLNNYDRENISARAHLNYGENFLLEEYDKVIRKTLNAQ